jgi:DNA-binding NtrC family response regulator
MGADTLRRPATGAEASDSADAAGSDRGISILVVDDEYTLRESCSSVLRMEGYGVSSCGTASEALSLVRRRSFDIVLLDLYLDGASGLDVLRACRESSPGGLVIIMTGNPTVGSSVEALANGAWDYLPKPFSATHLQILVGRAAHAVEAGRHRESARRTDGGAPTSHSHSITLLGRSPAFCRAVDMARRVARTDASVFITGESGTGKEMIAQFIHSESRRAARPLVAVNCAALPESLLESEMFGHVKGAFTGAVKEKLGLLEAADGGTFFLDELTEMSQTIQAKLLRVLQDGVVRRVGSEVTDAVVNVRFVAATNRDPLNAAEEGVLRRDLFYRLSVVPIHLPPLRERREDIPLLADHFLRYYWKRHRDPGAPTPRLTPEALALLQGRTWRGNVRELQNVVEHTVVLAEPGADVHPDDIPFRDEHESGTAGTLLAHVGDEPYHAARERVLIYLRTVVERAGTNLSRAAKMAGVDRTTLYRLMEKHGLHRNSALGAA